jgi:hypothetical protein
MVPAVALPLLDEHERALASLALRFLENAIIRPG